MHPDVMVALRAIIRATMILVVTRDMTHSVEGWCGIFPRCPMR
jgi:hypothetical protein